MKKILSVVLILFCLFSCKKDVIPAEEVSKSSNLRETSGPSLTCDPTRSTTELAKAFLHDAKDLPGFKKIVYDNCFQQRSGDYYVRIADLIDLNQTLQFWSEEKAQYYRSLVEACKCEEDIEPIVFVPFLEDKDQKYIDDEMFPAECPVAVFSADYDVNGATCRGYTLDANEEFVPDRNIDEDYAWANPIWVFGQEEQCYEENMVAADDNNGTGNRSPGGPEYGGIIQVTNMGAIEPWSSGKFEFYNVVLNSSGGRIGGKAFGKWKRDHFKNQKWMDFNYFIGNWHTSTFGNWMIENWFEDDGGNSNSVTINVPPPAGQPGPTVSTTIPSKNRDDNLQLAVVQFTDPLSTIYQISYANFKRKF